MKRKSRPSTHIKKDESMKTKAIKNRKEIIQRRNSGRHK